MQAIRYNVRESSFRPRILEALRGWSDRSRQLEIPLDPGGYEREVDIVISPADGDTFRSTWSGAESRFSARLRAAATALRDLRLHGKYRAEHRAGKITLVLLHEAE